MLHLSITSFGWLVTSLSSITYDNAFSRFASITELANSLHFMDSTPDIPEDPQKAVHTAAAPSFGPPAFEKTSHTISLIEQMDVEVTPQVIWILDPISAKVPWTNTHYVISEKK